jgi:H+/Cl- antiporter ClcA
VSAALPKKSRVTAPILLGDFTATRRMVPIAAIAIAIGALAAYLALALLSLIAFFTNVFYFHRLSVAPASPAQHTLGLAAALVPVAGGLIIGLVARFGSERIRGHGIPEALEAILVGGSRVDPKVALLKPISSAISIGSGGPFGAEGPIILTGGAFGSLIAQLFKLTSAERKTLLVAGAAAGMSATFAAPLAATLLAVELLLFEFKPRSFVPVALASATAATFRHFVLGPGPIFPLPEHLAFPGIGPLLACVGSGALAAGLSALLTVSVYAAEDLFKRLPLHWMWWPAIGGLAIGLGGLVCPSALGVGYDVIGALLAEQLPWKALVLLVVVKGAIWSFSLGSGTSGGVLAPLLMLGAALGAAEAHVFPGAGIGFWPLVSMGAILGGTMRSPLTGIVFAVELTHDMNMILPLVIAVTVAHAVTVLTLRRSILTEKVARRGFHVSREYAVDTLEVLFVRDVMNERPIVLDAAHTSIQAIALIDGDRHERSQQLFPLLDGDAKLVGAVTHGELLVWGADADRSNLALGQLAGASPATVFTNETLRTAVYRMAEKGLTRLLVVNAADASRLVGVLALHDLLKARARHLEEEERRERILPWEFITAEAARSSRVPNDLAEAKRLL